MQNTTDRVMILSDLRVEIQPRARLDLSKACHTKDISRSRDLQKALHSKRLKILHRIAPEKKQPPPVAATHTTTVIEKKSDLTEEKIANVVRQVMSEMKPELVAPSQTVVIQNADINAVLEHGMNKLLEQVSNKLSSISPNNSVVETSIISGDVLANLQEKAMNKISSEIESSETHQPAKSVTIKSEKSLRDLADEL